MSRYAKGDVVEAVVRYGGGREKVRRGVVVSVGARGVEVRFDDDRSCHWQRDSQLRRVAAEEASAHLVPPPRKLRAVPPPPAEEPPVPPSAQLDPAVLEILTTPGVDPLATWRGLGRALVDEARMKVVAAEASEAAARALHAEAQRELAEARAQLAALEHRVGGGDDG